MRTRSERWMFVVCGSLVFCAGCQMPSAGDVHPFWGRVFSWNKSATTANTAALPPGPSINAPSGYALAPGYTLPPQSANTNQYGPPATYNAQPAQQSAAYANNAAASGPYGAWANPTPPASAVATPVIPNAGQAPATAEYLQAYSQQAAAPAYSQQAAAPAAYSQPATSTPPAYSQPAYSPQPYAPMGYDQQPYTPAQPAGQYPSAYSGAPAGTGATQ